jgi:hypothetical protein
MIDMVDDFKEKLFALVRELYTPYEISVMHTELVNDIYNSNQHIEPQDRAKAQRALLRKYVFNE